MELREGSLAVEGELVNAPAIRPGLSARGLTGRHVIQIPARSRIEHRPQVGETFEIAVPYAHQPLFSFVPGGATRRLPWTWAPPRWSCCWWISSLAKCFRAPARSTSKSASATTSITRIEAARKPENLAALQRAIVMETIQPLLLRACERAGRALARIAGGAIAGNTTMLHLLVGEDPTPLGIRAVHAAISSPADRLRPPIGVGGSPACAGNAHPDCCPASRPTSARTSPREFMPPAWLSIAAPSLLVDIGTNGEIVLQSGGKLTACATAAGPAFEGCGLRCGTRARDGRGQRFATGR